jgi:hypothetical protein
MMVEQRSVAGGMTRGSFETVLTVNSSTIYIALHSSYLESHATPQTGIFSLPDPVPA